MQLARYLNSTWEQWSPLLLDEKAIAMANGQTTTTTTANNTIAATANDASNSNSNSNKNRAKESSEQMHFHSTATSALGYFLSTGNYHAAGKHEPQPSGSSRYVYVWRHLVWCSYKS